MGGLCRLVFILWVPVVTSLLLARRGVGEVLGAIQPTATCRKHLGTCWPQLRLRYTADSPQVEMDGGGARLAVLKTQKAQEGARLRPAMQNPGPSAFLTSRKRGSRSRHCPLKRGRHRNWQLKRPRRGPGDPFVARPPGLCTFGPFRQPTRCYHRAAVLARASFGCWKGSSLKGTCQRCSFVLMPLQSVRG